jgi:hypothetical protein
MPTKRNRRVGVQSRKVKKPKNVSRKLSVSGKAKKRRSSTHGSGAHGSSTHRSGTRRRVQRGGVLGLSTGAGIGITAAGVVLGTALLRWYYSAEQVERRERLKRNQRLLSGRNE